MNREETLLALGLGPLWKLRLPPVAAEMPSRTVPSDAVASTEPAVSVTTDTPLVTPSPSSGVGSMGWEDLQKTVAACRQCRLCEQRKQAVLGVGDLQADWLFVGEGPGADEDEKGEPFVGQAGKLLDNMLAAIDLKRGNDVYIGNAVKCRPPQNRTPEVEEIETCHPYLERQIDLIQPRLIIALGRPAAQALLKTEIKISASRGHLHHYKGIPVIITYHPAYLLRNMTDKAKAWEDLCFMRQTMRLLKDKTN